MSLRIKIETKLQGALKERNKLKISTLRLILATRTRKRTCFVSTDVNPFYRTKGCRPAPKSENISASNYSI